MTPPGAPSYDVWVVISNIGFSPFSALKTVANDVVSVARDPRAQAAASVVAANYAPQQYAAAQSYSRQVAQVLHPGQRITVQNPVPLPQGVPMYDDDAAPARAQKGNILPMVAIAGGGLLLLILLLKK